MANNAELYSLNTLRHHLNLIQVYVFNYGTDHAITKSESNFVNLLTLFLVKNLSQP